MSELIQERIALYKETVRQQSVPKRVLNHSNFYTWKYLDAGYSLKEALVDYEKLYHANMRFVERYPHDCHPDLGARNPIAVTNTLGNDLWTITDDGMNIRDESYMADEDYDLIIADPKKYIWEVFMPRKNKFLQQENAVEVFQNGINEYARFAAYLKRVAKDAQEIYDVPTYFSSQAMFQSYDQGHEFLFNVLRGMKKLSVDVRRDPEKVMAAIRSIETITIDPIFEKLYALPGGSDPNALADQMLVLLSHAFLSGKQFGTFYWPFLKRIGEYAETKDKIFYVFLEASSERFWDYFKDLPKGHFLFHVEMDDIYQMRKACPNLAFAGGMPSELLGRGKPEECVAKTKELCETLGADGGYMFSESKIMSYFGDAKSENLKAVCDYMQTL